jgi:cobalt-precorrin 5A hydrolase/precorrin-3B C17-methyltransferase
LSSFAAITTTPAGVNLLLPLCASLPATLWLPEGLADGELSQPIGLQPGRVRTYSGPLRETLATLWTDHDGLIFTLATGAVVRLIAPLLQDKATDPAVVVVDVAGKFAISLCGGHQGGGDTLAQTISHHLPATPVLTGSANHLSLPGIDVLGGPCGWTRGSGNWTGVASAIAQGQPVQVVQEAGSELWQHHLPPDHPFQFGWPEVPASQASQPPQPRARVWISPIQRRFSPTGGIPRVQWHPRVLWVGVGCERGTSKDLIAWAIESVCQSRHLALGSIAGLASLDLKADEAGLVNLCQERQWPLRCFTAAALKAIPVPHPSDVVAAAVGTPSVAEAAAILAASTPELPLPACSLAGAAVETGPPQGLGGGESGSGLQPETRAGLCVSKKVFRHPDWNGAVTVAITQAAQEYLGRPGHLALVGTGPGHLDQITPAAKAAIVQADVVIGYTLYIEQIRPLCRPGQIVEPWPITQERQRGERAIALANWGLKVAVVSSGDCGIYGMAGLVMEQLQTLGWDGETPSVQVYPGISALQAAAARVGAPLMHDFCAISLSDLLTPWDVIIKRLGAAAQADFVIALYNPKSKTRVHQIETARDILLAHRPAQTPVAIVKSVYRPDEEIYTTSLKDMLTHPIDMLTLVLIGNQSTRQQGRWMVTPRGYLGNRE